MTSATYKYSLKADSGYKSEQSGKISPERHGVVCAALDGGFSDDVILLRAAPDLLSDLKEAAQLLRNYEKLHREKGTEDGLIKADRNRAWAEQFEATLAKALGEKT